MMKMKDDEMMSRSVYLGVLRMRQEKHERHGELLAGDLEEVRV